MSKEKKNFLKIVSSISGMIIGAGIFTLPWVGSQSGFFTFLFWLAIVSLLLISIHLMYVQVVVSTPFPHRFIGYVNYYFGKKAKILVALIILFIIWGSLLIYLILGSRFLAFTFGFSSLKIPLFIFFLISALVVYFDLKNVSYLELISILMIFLIVLAVFLLSFNSSSSFSFWPKDFKGIFLPYGLLFYALYGVSSIPEIVPLVGGSKSLLRKSIIFGTVFPAFVYFLFVFAFLKIFPKGSISPDAIYSFNFSSGYLYFFGKILGVFGFLAISTSFWIFALNLKESFHFDFGLPKKISWFLSCFVPLVLYFFKFNNLIKIVSLIGTLGLGSQAIIIIFLFKKIKELEKKDEILKKESIVDFDKKI